MRNGENTIQIFTKKVCCHPLYHSCLKLLVTNRFFCDILQEFWRISLLRAGKAASKKLDSSHAVSLMCGNFFRNVVLIFLFIGAPSFNDALFRRLWSLVLLSSNRHSNAKISIVCKMQKKKKISEKN